MITESNLVIELNNCVNGLVMLNAKLDSLKPGSPGLQEQIKEAEQEYIEINSYLSEIFPLVAKTKPDPETIGTKLKDSITLITQMLNKLASLKKSGTQ